MADESLAKIQVNGVQIGSRRVGNGPPLLVLNGFAATSADWDPSFIDRLASSNELVLIAESGTRPMPESHSTSVSSLTTLCV